jgi:hypothetical protein
LKEGKNTRKSRPNHVEWNRITHHLDTSATHHHL